MKFDLVVANPPFQDTNNRGKTPHKLWIDFTKATFSNWLNEGGYLAQVSPSSFRSPNSAILELIKQKETPIIRFDSGEFFPGVGSSFADYIIRNNTKKKNSKTLLIDGDNQCLVKLDQSVKYLPNRIDVETLSIHEKVMFSNIRKLDVRWDYVTCHNILIHRSNTLSKTESQTHIYPLLHTNSQTWWSSVKQDFFNKKKVMWSRSGYTKPFFDRGSLGGTDMVYYVPVSTIAEGKKLEQILNSKLFKFVYQTAKWSGFGNERVFCLLPNILDISSTTDDSIFEFFSLSSQERDRVTSIVG